MDAFALEPSFSTWDLMAEPVREFTGLSLKIVYKAQEVGKVEYFIAAIKKENI